MLARARTENNVGATDDLSNQLKRCQYYLNFARQELDREFSFNFVYFSDNRRSRKALELELEVKCRA